MPHSSGGGSCGGGSHGGGGGSGSGGHSTRSNTYLPGYDRYCYYKKGTNRPIYFYSSVDITPKSIAKKKRSAIVMAVILSAVYLFAIIAIVSSMISNPKKLDMDYFQNDIVIQDDLGIITDTEEAELMMALEDFQMTTGITPAIVTADNSSWMGNFVNLEKCAYNLYINMFDDEKHWLIIYTQPLGADPTNNSMGFVDWYWEGMQGDDTDSILTQSVTNKFTEAFHDRLVDNRISVGQAFIDSFEELTPTIMDKKFDPMVFLVVGFILLHGSLFFMGFVIMPLKQAKKDASSIKIGKENAPALEDTCAYCGGLYIHGRHLSCPHCGAVIPPLNQEGYNANSGIDNYAPVGDLDKPMSTDW